MTKCEKLYSDYERRAKLANYPIGDPEQIKKIIQDFIDSGATRLYFNEMIVFKNANSCVEEYAIMMQKDYEEYQKILEMRTKYSIPYTGIADNAITEKIIEELKKHIPDLNEEETTKVLIKFLASEDRTVEIWTKILFKVPIRYRHRPNVPEFFLVEKEELGNPYKYYPYTQALQNVNKHHSELIMPQICTTERYLTNESGTYAAVQGKVIIENNNDK